MVQTDRGILFVPITPGGTVLLELASETENEAWKKLMRASAHMPYCGREQFERRGYRVAQTTDEASWQ